MSWSADHIQKYPRTYHQVQVSLDRYANVIADFCNAGDPVCASGDDLDAHMEYPEYWDTTAATFVKQKLLALH